MLKVETDWWQTGHDLLVLTGKRLDAPAAPLRRGGVTKANDSRPAGAGHYFATAILPTEGCWEITGKIYGRDDSALSFVVDVKSPK